MQSFNFLLRTAHSRSLTILFLLEIAIHEIPTKMYFFVHIQEMADIFYFLMIGWVFLHILLPKTIKHSLFILGYLNRRHPGSFNIGCWGTDLIFLMFLHNLLNPLFIHQFLDSRINILIQIINLLGGLFLLFADDRAEMVGTLFFLGCVELVWDNILLFLNQHI